MKKLVTNYSFDAAQGIVTLSDYTAIDIERLLLITNVTDNIIIYNFADPAKGGLVSGNTIDLSLNTSSMSNSDDLQIYYDDISSASTEETLQAIAGLIDYLKILVNQTKTLSTQDTNQRQRTVVENTVGVGTVATVTSITNAVNIASTYSELAIRQESSRNAYANGIRQNLTF